jgi:hypothetical protein
MKVLSGQERMRLTRDHPQPYTHADSQSSPRHAIGLEARHF